MYHHHVQADAFENVRFENGKVYVGGNNNHHHQPHGGGYGGGLYGGGFNYDYGGFGAAPMPQAHHGHGGYGHGHGHGNGYGSGGGHGVMVEGMDNAHVDAILDQLGLLVPQPGRFHTPQLPPMAGFGALAGGAVGGGHHGGGGEGGKGPETVNRQTYDYRARNWKTDSIQVEIEPRAFSEGAMRAAYKMKIIGDKNTRYVAKAMKKGGMGDERRLHFDDVIMQETCRELADQYNKLGPPKKVRFLQAFVIERAGRRRAWMCCEPYLTGDYQKFNNNNGYVSADDRNTPQAFSHFSHTFTGGKYLICDIQGVGTSQGKVDYYTDPQIHTSNGNGFGLGNLGKRGMDAFFKSHRCNMICVGIGLVGKDKLMDQIGTGMPLPARPVPKPQGAVPATPPPPPPTPPVDAKPHRPKVHGNDSPKPHHGHGGFGRVDSPKLHHGHGSGKLHHGGGSGHGHGSGHGWHVHRPKPQSGPHAVVVDPQPYVQGNTPPPAPPPPPQFPGGGQYAEGNVKKVAKMMWHVAGALKDRHRRGADTPSEEESPPPNRYRDSPRDSPRD
eukprot:TRINITY_DN63821_c0_g1_i1.p1 TRINITY_DN63821_c0_g1~~TRINITY_DN63821_c0_g1_i1.p1  ORF type:complete len:554 (+),score=50.64 TRINITY_DN63821_c0_g1_i1:74-1735(+)